LPLSSSDPITFYRSLETAIRDDWRSEYDNLYRGGTEPKKLRSVFIRYKKNGLIDMDMSYDEFVVSCEDARLISNPIIKAAMTEGFGKNPTKKSLHERRQLGKLRETAEAYGIGSVKRGNLYVPAFGPYVLIKGGRAAKEYGLNKNNRFSVDDLLKCPDDMYIHVSAKARGYWDGGEQSHNISNLIHDINICAGHGQRILAVFDFDPNCVKAEELAYLNQLEIDNNCVQVTRSDNVGKALENFGFQKIQLRSVLHY